MKALIKGLLALCLIVGGGVAFAGWNLKQTDTGGAVWENQDGETIGVGGPLTVRITGVSTAGTSYVVAHKAGVITTIRGVSLTAFNAGSNDLILTFFLAAAAATDVSLTQITPNAQMTLLTLDGLAGNYSVSPTGANTVVQGGLIAIISNGGPSGGPTGTGDDVMLTIIIE